MSSASSDDKNNKEQKPTVITIRKKKKNVNQSLSSMSVHEKSITTISPDRECIPGKKKKRNLQ